MIRHWIAAHRSLVITSTSAVLVGVLVVTAAVVAGGYTAQRLDLGTGSVWVAGGAQQAVGRANTAVLAIDTVIEDVGPTVAIEQQGETVLLVDLDRDTLGVVDPATARVTDSSPLPSDASAVFLASGTVMVLAGRTGAVWILPLDDVERFDATADPTLVLGTDAIASVSPAGNAFVYSAASGEVSTLDLASGTVRSTIPAGLAVPIARAQLSSVDGRWLLLDDLSGELSIDGTPTDLSGELAGAGSGAVLQLAADVGDGAVIAHRGGLLDVPLGGGDPRVLQSEPHGAPAAPAMVGGCLFAAWGDGALWRQCGGAEATEIALDGFDGMATAASPLEFTGNGTTLVLAHRRTGGVWAAQGAGEPIDNWADLLTSVDTPERIDTITDDSTVELEDAQVPPVAVDDELGARPGRSTVLPVLLNDFDANGDALVIDDVVPIDDAVGRVDVAGDRQTVLIALTDSAAGAVSFGYTVSDGRGGTSSATVSVTIRAVDENGAPAQVRRTGAVTIEGGSVTAPTIGDWVDPDGDPFYLAAAVTGEPDSTTFRPGGLVTFDERGGAGPLRSVALTMSDGRAQGTGVLTVTVNSPGNSPLVAEQFAVVTPAGLETAIRPLEHVRGGSGRVQLVSATAASGASAEANPVTGIIRFSSQETRTHIVEYVASDGQATVTGTVRVDVTAPADASTAPITIPKTVFVRSQGSESIDVAGTDVDPAGGVLQVTGVSEIPAGSGIVADVLEQRDIRVTLTSPLLTGPVGFAYAITNGLSSSRGVVTVVEILPPASLQPPRAEDDSATVRVGDVIDIPVLDNDVHPDGEPLTLSPRLVTGPGVGLAFVSGGMLRFLAPETAGDIRVVYEVAAPDGQVDQAEVTISVRESVLATNTAPVPRVVTARVVAGETVRVRIPLTGIDRDGDSVQLVGQNSSPLRGAVTAVGSDFFDYTAGDYAAGTDSFGYLVIDALGARASGAVRVGITPRSAGSRNPVALADVVTIAPGRTASVAPLANDSDPDGRTLTISSVEPNSDGITAVIDGDRVFVTPPAAPGRYGVVYSIDNGAGGSGSNFITVIVDPDAPPAYPVIRDTVLTLSDILDRDTVTVDVLRNVTFPDGDVSSLRLGVLAGFDGASVTRSGRIAVDVADTRRIVPFSVANPDDPSIRSYGFIWVPGRDDALPQLDPTAPALTVASESTLSIDLTEYVIAAAGADVRLVDSASVVATRANGDSLVIDSQTLRFTSEAGYFGPASISFEVTDAGTADDPDGNRATLVLAITVTPRENQPPVFQGAAITFEPGEEKTIDLLRLTTYPYPDDLGELRWSARAAPPAGFDYTITGSTLVIGADEDATAGTATSITLGVDDRTGTGQPGRIDLEVVGSTRPLARPAADEIVAPRGRSTVVDVLANDTATNPFPATPLTVIAIRGLDAASVPDGVAITPTADRSRLTVTVSATAAALDTTLQYQVADATRDPTRNVWGTVRISVQDVPDAPDAPTRAAGAYEDGVVTLRLTAPRANNAPITGYTVVSSSHGAYRADCGTKLRCTLTDLEPGLDYAFSAIATNAIGASPTGAPSTPIGADFLPDAPASVVATATGANPGVPTLAVRWDAVADPRRGSPIAGYTVRILGPGVDSETTVRSGTTSIETTARGALVAGAQYTATVSATNGSSVTGPTDWRSTRSAPVTAIGPPGQVAGGVQPSRSGTGGDIRVSWGASDTGGKGDVVYSVGRFDAGVGLPTSCTSGARAPGVGAGAASVDSGWTDTTATDGTDYRYVVYSDNGMFCTPTASGAIESKTVPGPATGTTTVEVRDGRFDLRAGALGATGIVDHFEARLGDGGWTRVSDRAWITSAQDSAVYGTVVSVAYRACRDESQELCGTSSAGGDLRPVDTRGTIVSCLPGEVPVSRAPANAGSPSVFLRYSFHDGGIASGWSDFSENAVAPAPAAVGTGQTQARLSTVVTFGSDESYADDGYAELTCGGSG